MGLALFMRYNEESNGADAVEIAIDTRLFRNYVSMINIRNVCSRPIINWRLFVQDVTTAVKSRAALRTDIRRVYLSSVR